MPQPKTDILNYSIRKQGKFYIISNDHKDIFYYNTSVQQYTYPHQISIDIFYFEDVFLDYIYNKINFRNIPENKIEFYLNLYFARLIKYPDFEKFHIDDMLLNRNGRLDPFLFNFYENFYFSIESNIAKYLIPGKSYSKETSGLVFHYMETKSTSDVLLAECEEITRSQFEEHLSNFELQFTYVEFYYKSNVFYLLPIIEESIYYGYFSYCYLMFNKKNLVMFYFI
jgi:hypothetical protein